MDGDDGSKQRRQATMTNAWPMWGEADGNDDDTNCGSNNQVKLDHHLSSLANLNTNSTLSGTV